MYKNTDAFIVSAVRTPIGKYGGSLSSLSAPQLGSIVIKGALERCNISPDDVDEVYFGNVLQANVGQNPARQAALGAGLPNKIPCTTINKVCASGLKSIQLACNSIRCGEHDIVIAGGMESMSNVPYYIPSQDIRIHSKSIVSGNKKIIDGMIYDGLTNVYDGKHMGLCAEKCAIDYNISKKQQDDYAILSFQRCKKANDNGIFKQEIIPVTIKLNNGKTKIINQDEGFSQFDAEKLRKLKPSFTNDKNGSVTAGNASQLSDGASCIILVSGKYLNNNKNNLKALAKIISYADIAQEPINFTTSPSLAIPKALKNGNININELNNNDYFEINEAFAVVSIVNEKLLNNNNINNINNNNINIYGGAIALGHPLGCSGARIIVTLLNVLKNNNNSRYGIASLCNGGGGAGAIVIQNLQKKTNDDNDDNCRSKL